MLQLFDLPLLVDALIAFDSALVFVPENIAEGTVIVNVTRQLPAGGDAADAPEQTAWVWTFDGRTVMPAACYYYC